MEGNLISFRINQQEEEIKALRILEKENGSAHIRLENAIFGVQTTLNAQNVPIAEVQKDIQEVKLRPGQNYSKLLWIGLGLIVAVLSNIVAGLIVRGMIHF